MVRNFLLVNTKQLEQLHDLLDVKNKLVAPKNICFLKEDNIEIYPQGPHAKDTNDVL